MKKAILIMLVLLVGSVAAITSNVQWHTLQQIQKSASDASSVDADGDGRIDASVLPASVGGKWSENPSDSNEIFYDSGFVGVGNSDPEGALHIDDSSGENIEITDGCGLSYNSNTITCTQSAYAAIKDSGHLARGARVYMRAPGEVAPGFQSYVTGFSDSAHTLTTAYRNLIRTDSGANLNIPQSASVLSVSTENVMVGSVSDRYVTYLTRLGIIGYDDGLTDDEMDVSIAYSFGNGAARIRSSGGISMWMDTANKWDDDGTNVPPPYGVLFGLYHNGDSWACPPCMRLLEINELGDATLQGSLSEVSDSRLKKDVAPFTGALDTVLALDAVYYTSVDPDNTKRQVGMIAQDVEEVLPEVVNTDSEGYKSLEYSRMTAVLVEAVKEQQATIEQLQKEVDELKERLG